MLPSDSECTIPWKVGGPRRPKVSSPRTLKFERNASSETSDDRVAPLRIAIHAKPLSEDYTASSTTYEDRTILNEFIKK